ncbi:MAG: tRNA pseudouridine38-40 synthase [Halanaerobiales bacterium]|nr:tRNA pseudouridine38-40 synthase [Halanaerobiales bacterium]
MRNIKITLEYDGTNYSGWQIQKNTEQTIQQILQDALSEINKSPVKVTGASRTDAGVHALGQVANFKLDVPIPLARIPMALNSLLPEDIVCKEAREVDLDFHARYDARGKKYRYRILNQAKPSVFIRNYVYHYSYPLDLNLMREAASYLIGTHDFNSFQASGSSIRNTVRTIEKLEVIDRAPEVWIEVKGDGFLYNMVRIIAGTLIEVASGKILPDRVKDILAARDRTRAGFTAPARGLILLKVYY